MKFSFVGISTLALLTTMAGAAFAQDHSHGITAPAAPLTDADKRRVNDLVADVRKATEAFKDVTAAEAAGYTLGFGCVSGSGDEGAMGLHYINGALVGDGIIDKNQPEIILYEPLANGGVRITGADYLVDAATWDAHNPGPPELDGQLFHLFDAPNRFGLKAFYTLHVWAWKHNPNGTFTNWNPTVSCENFNPE
jgi:hypothetical protein